MLRLYKKFSEEITEMSMLVTVAFCMVSTQNQRIECLWGMVRRQGMQYWINFFQELAESGFHDGGYLDQELSRFCFLEMVQVRQADKNCFLKK